MPGGVAMKYLLFAIFSMALVGCATLTSDAMTPVALSFSDGSSGSCKLTNKRGVWTTEAPITIPVRRSDDALKYDCKTESGQEAVGQIESTVGAKIVASAVFIDLGITDAITDKHREYPASFVIPVGRKAASEETASSQSSSVTNSTPESETRYADIEKLNDLRERGLLTDEEFEAEKKRVLEQN